MPARAPATKIESLRKLRRSNLPKSRHILPTTNRAVLRPSQFLLTTPNLFRVRLLVSLSGNERRPRSLRFWQRGAEIEREMDGMLGDQKGRSRFLRDGGSFTTRGFAPTIPEANCIA